MPQLEKNNVQFFFETKSNLTENDIIQFRKAGITHIQPGIESLSSEILKLMNKGVKGFQNIQLLKWCATHNIKPDWLYLYNLPNEPIKPYFREIKIFRQLAHLPPPMSPNPVVLNRYSHLFENRDALGYSEVKPLEGTQIYYQNLTENERMNISYQFAGRLPQGIKPIYERALWKEISLWKSNYSNGNRLFQFVGETMTLVFDSRNNKHDWYLLSGNAHSLYQSMKYAKPFKELCEVIISPHLHDMKNTLIISDTIIKHKIKQLDATELPIPRNQNELKVFLSELVDNGLVINIDKRYLALAIDCYSATEIKKCGLTV